MKTVALGLLLALAVRAHADEYLVKYKNAGALQRVQSLAALKSGDVSIVDQHEKGSYVVLDVGDFTRAETLGRLMQDDGIDWVTPNFELHAFTQPFEMETLKTQWAVAKVNAEQAWARAGNRGSRNVVVAVIDTGVDYKHQSLAPNMVAGHDFRDNDDDPMDETGRNPGHGTHCAGVIGATGLIDGGTIGISPEVSVMPLRFLGPNGSGDLNSSVKAIDYAIEHKAQVISASWGAAVPRAQSRALIEAIKRADDAGIIFVMAAANDGKSNDEVDVFPANANFDNTITVAATNTDDTKPSWSNYGKVHVQIASPGAGILSTLPGDKYGNLSGTSMATPLVAGLVAFLKAQDATLTGAQIKALLQTTGSHADVETACHCRIDAFAAVDRLLSKKPWLVPAAASLNANETVKLTVQNGVAPFKFVTNPAVATVDEAGVLHAVNAGVTGVTVTDATGQTVSSSEFNVLGAAGADPGDGKSCSTSGSVCRGICYLFPRMKMCQK